MSTDAKAMIHPAIIRIMRAVEPIAKDQRNQQQNYNFRGIDQVYNAVHPHFAEHGVYSTSTVLEAEHREAKSEKGKAYIHVILKLRFTFWAEDGSSVATEIVAEGMDYGGDKASNKAMSTAHKYAILQILNIPTAAIDNDQGRQRPRSPNAERVRMALVAIDEAPDETKLTIIRNRISKSEYTDEERELLNERLAAKLEAFSGAPA